MANSDFLVKNGLQVLGGNANVSGNLAITGTFIIANTIAANGTSNVGTAGYVLTSGGAGSNVFWSLASAGVNTAAQYTFSNTITFTNGINLSANTIQNYIEYANSTVTISSTSPVSIPANSNVVRYLLSSNATLTLPQGTVLPTNSAKALTVYVKQDGTGGRTLAFANQAGDTLRYNNSLTLPQPATSANFVSIYNCQRFDGDTNWYVSLSYLGAA
jgi:hypothetical protein